MNTDFYFPAKSEHNFSAKTAGKNESFMVDALKTRQSHRHGGLWWA